MSKIRNKISSIEADDDVVSRALGLHPVKESEPLAPVAPADEIKTPSKPKAPEAKVVEKPKKEVEKTPAIVSRPLNYSDDSTMETRWPLWVTLAFSLFWIVGTLLAITFLLGFKNISSYSAGQLGGLAFFVLFPLMLIGVVYTALRNLSGLSGQAARLQTAADALMQVDETVVRRATEMSGVIKREIDTLNSGIDTALSRASTLHDAIETETEKLGETSLAIEDKTQRITERLSTEREALWSISNSFDEQMKALTTSLDSHSENLAMSTKTAEQKIQEARLSVENTASKINQTSDLIRNNTMEAATTLTGNQEEILKLSDQLKQRATELDDIYQKHGQDLNAMIAQLRNEQDVLSQSLEERLSKMRDVALSAQVSAERLTEASEAGRQTVMSLSEASKLSENAIKNRFSEMEEMVKYSNAKAENISEQAARRVQDSLSQTRKEISRIESDMLNLQEKMSEAGAAATETRAQNTSPAEFLEEPEIETDSDELVVPPKKSKGALSFRPLEDDSQSTHTEEDLDFSETKSQPSNSSRITGLRPAPSQQTQMERANPEITTENSDLDLTIEDGLMRPAADQMDDRPTDIVRSVEDSESISKSWWKNLFGKSDNPIVSPPSQNTPSANPPFTPRAGASTLGAARATIAKAQPAPIQSENALLASLRQNGLSPNAIVDNGCIIDAVENRVQHGTKQMSVGVAKRLGEPIHLLSSLLNDDTALKNQAVDFAIKFHHSLTSISDSPEALADKFGTEDGRLFLMCDAALNS